MKKLLALILAIAMLATLAACGSTGDTGTPSTPAADPSGTTSGDQATQPAAGGELYYLNFKPEIAPVYDEIAAAYEAETGVKLHVVTAASGTYEQTLKSEIAKADAPVLFQINGPKGYANWKDYCADLSGTELYQHLTDQGPGHHRRRQSCRHPLRGRGLRHHLQQRDHGEVFRPRRREGQVDG